MFKTFFFWIHIWIIVDADPDPIFHKGQIFADPLRMRIKNNGYVMEVHVLTQ